MSGRAGRSLRAAEDGLNRGLEASTRHGQADRVLAVLVLPAPERAMLIGQLHASDRGQVLAEVLTDVETDPYDLVRLWLIAALRELLV